MRDLQKMLFLFLPSTKEGLTELLDRINVSLYPGENTAYYILFLMIFMANFTKDRRF